MEKGEIVLQAECPKVLLRQATRKACKQLNVAIVAGRALGIEAIVDKHFTYSAYSKDTLMQLKLFVSADSLLTTDNVFDYRQAVRDVTAQIAAALTQLNEQLINCSHYNLKATLPFNRHFDTKVTRNDTDYNIYYEPMGDFSIVFTGKTPEL